MEDPYDRYYEMDAWRALMDSARTPYVPVKPMMYYGQGGQQGGQQQQQQGSNPSQMYDMYKSLSGGTGTVATGMTPNATNAAGESYYGWGAQTGDWGATAGTPAMEAAGTTGSGTMGGAESTGGLWDSIGGMFGGGGGEGASSVGYGTLGYILAAIAGQHMMSSDTDRQFSPSGAGGSSHRTGDVFSGDFFTEPWMAYAYDKLGVEGATPGEETDSSINAIRDGESAWDNLLRSAPATAAQWFDPVGSFGYGLMEDKLGTFGKWLGRAAFPVHWLADMF